MPFMASDPMRRANPLLNDDAGVRWPFAERLMWINDAMSEILTLKPTAFADSRVIQTRAGTRQPLPADAAALIRVVRNIKEVDDGERRGGRAISTVARVDMDAIMPDWHDQDVHGLTETVTHAIVDPVAEPLTWYAYPPQGGQAQVEIVVAKRPAALALASGTSGTALASYDSLTVPLDAEYLSPVTDFLLYRAFLKEAEFAGSAQRAQAHYAAFANSLGVKLANEVRFTTARTLADKQP